MGQELKKKYAFWMRPDTKAKIEEIYRSDNCSSQSEFVEKAVSFYAEYIAAKDSSKFLPLTLTAMIRGTMDDSESRIARLLFKMAVEQSMMMHVLASEVEITDEELSRLRGRCVNEVKRTGGRINFDDAVKFQRGE